MNHREVLIGTVCTAVTAESAGTNHEVRASRWDQAFLSCWQITLDRALWESDQTTALFVLGGCDCAIAEIAKLNLPTSAIAYFDDSVPGPHFGRFMAECWNVDRERISKIDNAMEFAKRTIDANDRVVLLGNFSAPFASHMLFSLAALARDMNRPVIAIGGTPAPGVQGEIRMQRGWTCIEELRRIGCCVTTVPEVNFDSDQFDQSESMTTSPQLGVDEGSPYCRALELALNQFDFDVASISEDVLTSTFSAGNLVSLGWGDSTNGYDAATATNIALANGYGLSEPNNCDITTQVLVTSNSDEILEQLRTSTESVSDAIGTTIPIYFGASHNPRVTNNALQVTVFR